MRSPAVAEVAETIADEPERLQPNQAFSHYMVISSLGRGGMGEVYLAEDTRLGRRVALKVLSRNVADDKERLRRFEQEANAASALNHPNILTVHEFGFEAGVHFLVTEFVDGETLARRSKTAAFLCWMHSTLASRSRSPFLRPTPLELFTAILSLRT